MFYFLFVCVIDVLCLLMCICHLDVCAVWYDMMVCVYVLSLCVMLCFCYVLCLCVLCVWFMVLVLFVMCMCYMFSLLVCCMYVVVCMLFVMFYVYHMLVRVYCYVIDYVWYRYVWLQLLVACVILILFIFMSGMVRWSCIWWIVFLLLLQYNGIHRVYC